MRKRLGFGSNFLRVPHVESPADARRAIVRAQENSRRFLVQLQKVAPELSERDLKSAVREYLFSGIAALDACKREYVEDGGFPPSEFGALQLVATSRNLDLTEMSGRPAVVKPKKHDLKPDRLVIEFHPLDRMRQRLVKRVLAAAFQPPSFQYQGKGRGCIAARAALREALHDPQFTHVVQADIKNFYGSINQDAAVEATPLPRGVAKAVLPTSSYRFVWGDTQSRLAHGCIPQPSTIPLGKGVGIPQGSACSGILAAMVLRDLRDLVENRTGSNAHLIVYEDDIIILCRSRREGDRLLRALKAALEAHLVGPFCLGVGRVLALDQPVNFLGCRFQRTRTGSVEQDVSEVRREDLLFFLGTEILHGGWPACPLPESVINRIKGLYGAYRDCPAFLGELAEIEAQTWRW